MFLCGESLGSAQQNGGENSATPPLLAGRQNRAGLMVLSGGAESGLQR